MTDIYKARITFDDITRKLADGKDGELGGGGSDQSEEDEEWDSSEDNMEMDENQRKLMEFLAKKVEEEKDFILDYDSIIAELDGQLP